MKKLITGALLLSIAQFALGQIPTSFDLRHYNGHNYVTSIKSQQGGTCWTHGAWASVESNLLMNGNWTVAGDTGAPNLAEYHLDWWNGFNQHNNDDMSPPTGTGLVVHQGGDYRVTSAYIARLEGPVRDIDAQSFSSAPTRFDTSYRYYYVNDIEWYNMGQNLENIDVLKTKIMTHGVMGTCMCYKGSFIDQNYCHYQPPATNDEPNHAVAIIGWDDNKVTQAPLPGAWLVKNSWDTAWGINGYFWISYYDKHCGKNPEMGAISFIGTEAMPFDHVYYHDLHGWRDTMMVDKAMNYFVAEREEDIVAINFFTAADSVNYDIKIYDSYTGGIITNVLSSESGFFAHSGMHTVYLSNPVALTQGYQFAVVVELDKGGHAYDCTSEVPVLLGSTSRTTVPSSASYGESYYFYQNLLWMDMQMIDSTANFCIKALTIDDAGTSVPEHNSGLNLHIWPSPAQDVLNYTSGSETSISLSVYNLKGQCMKKLERTSASGMINIKDLPAGIYFLKVCDDNTVSGIKFIKK